MTHFIIRATLVCGILDILSAFAFAAVAGRTPVAVLQAVAAGPFHSPSLTSGATGALIGAVVHFGIMAVMVTVFAMAARNLAWIRACPIVAALVYALVVYAIMYWIVLPLRWPTVFPQTDLWNVGNALFSHLVCVGLPLGLLLVSSRAELGQAAALSPHQASGDVRI